ncbi:MAG TPA: hypothetical protein PLZ51_19250 [Aggregatilineales bacterium]|nr:hypothetical protein [Aggregatilineales bacterium]
MGFFRRRTPKFGTPGNSPELADKNAYFVYIRPKRCEEVVRVRINLANDLSLTDDESGYFVRKYASAQRCPFKAEVSLLFDRNRRLVQHEVENGEMVTQGDYVTWLESQGDSSKI